MDRNLGAMNTINPNGGAGSVWYQFGRKDPFAGGTLYKPDGTTISISNIAWNSDVITTKSSEKGKNVPYSVQNPLKFITGTTWTTGDQYCPADGGDFMWQDPKAAPRADGKVKKSIFDPCPSGWMVPMKETWAGFSDSNMLWETTKDEGIGRYYYPDRANYPHIYISFPASGYLQYSTGTINDIDKHGNSWTNSPYSSLAVVFHYRFNSVEQAMGKDRAQGNTVRCIQEYF